MTELTKTDVERLERYLRERREAVREILHAARSAARKQAHSELTGTVRDSGDESLADLLFSLDVAGYERELQELRDIEVALERIAHDSFGVCIDCDADIARDRLLIFPTAKRCFSCQQRHEFRRGAGVDTSPSL